MKRILALALFGAVLVCGSGEAAERSDPDKVLVRVGAHEIRTRDISLSSVLLRDAALSMSPDTVQDFVLSHLVETYVLADAARASGVSEDVAAMAASTVGDAIAPARASETPQMRELRLEYLKYAALGERYLARFDRSVDVSEDVLRARYVELSRLDEVHLRYIAAPTAAAAASARDRIAAGDSFESVARAISVDPESAPKGGDLGWLQRRLLTKEFAAAIADLKPGEISRPFQTELGWNLMQLVEARPVRLQTYMKAHDTLKRDVLTEARRARIADLERVADIEWFTRRPADVRREN